MANVLQQAFYSGGGPVSGAPYTPAVKAGNLVFISGQLGIDPETKKPYTDFEKQVEGAILGVKTLIEVSGGSLENLVKTTVFLSDIENFARLNEIYNRHFNMEIKPARSCFEVAALPLGADVEIEAIGYLPG